jgi:hypothetical protein
MSSIELAHAVADAETLQDEAATLCGNVKRIGTTVQGDGVFRNNETAMAERARTNARLRAAGYSFATWRTHDYTLRGWA